MRLPYPFNEIIAQSNMYEMSGFGKLKMIGKEVCLEIENVDILDKCTQKNASGTHIVNFLRKENIDIFRNLSSNDLKGLLEKKSLTVSAAVSRKRKGKSLPRKVYYITRILILIMQNAASSPAVIRINTQSILNQLPNMKSFMLRRLNWFLPASRTRRVRFLSELPDTSTVLTLLNTLIRSKFITTTV